MVTKCKIIFKRDPNTLKITDEIKAVKASNGKRSLLFDSIRNVVGNDTESLKDYYLTHTEDFKNKFNNVSLDKNGEPLYSEISDLFNSKISTIPTLQDGNNSNIRSKFFYDGDIKPHREILDRIINTGHPLSRLARKLKSLPIPNIPIALQESITANHPSTNEAMDSNGVYYYDENTIELSENLNNDTFPAVALHEILHGYTAYEIKRNTPAVQELNKLYREALKYKKHFAQDSTGDVYPLSNLDEFLVGAFTNSVFINDLMRIPSIGPNKSMWEDLLNYFKDLFKFNKGERSLFDDVFYTSGKIIEQGYKSLESTSRQLKAMEDSGFPTDDMYPSIAEVTIEDQYDLRDESGVRRQYTKDVAHELARELNSETKDGPFKFNVVKSGEDYTIKVGDKDEVVYSLDSTGFSQPDQTTNDGVRINVEAYEDLVGSNGFTEAQINILKTYNENTGPLTGNHTEVKVADLPSKLRQVFEKKGEETATVYETKDPATGELGYVTYRVSNIQDLKKVKYQTAKKAEAQEQNPKSVLARDMGTKMHELNEKVLMHLIESSNPKMSVTSLRDLDNYALWQKDAMEEFYKTDTYKKLKADANDIFKFKDYTDRNGQKHVTNDPSKMLNKLVESMMSLYHQVAVTQHGINNEFNKLHPNSDNHVHHKPVFMIEKPFLDKGADQAGTMDVFVVFSDGTASIYDHKFTDLNVQRKSFDKPTQKEADEIYRIREKQGLTTKRGKYNNWYYTLPDSINLFRKEESWNTQIGRYSEMVTQLYGVKGIRQARILPVATTYTKIDTGKKTKDGNKITVFDPDRSRVEVILTGIDDLGQSQIALEVEKTGDVNLDRFISLLINNKHELNDEMRERKAWGDPKYVDRIKKLDESIQALLKSRDITYISDSIKALANQIKSDLNNIESPITFEQITTHLGDIKMFETFITLSAGEIDKLETAHAEKIEAGEENPYSVFKTRLSEANYELAREAKAMQDQMTAMIHDVNSDNGFMTKELFSSFQKQVDMSAVGKQFTHLRESNHPIISLFSQLLDKIDTNVIQERRTLESKLTKATTDLKAWGNSKGLKGTDIYKSIIKKDNDLIRKYTYYVTEVFPDHSDPNAANKKWFKDNFERVGKKETLFQEKLKNIKAYFKQVTDSKEEYSERLGKWLNENDVKYNNGDNNAWFNGYNQYWLTPKNPEEYYTDEYKNILKPENKPLLDFYNLYTDQIGKLATKADFKIKENFIPEIRKDMIDTMVQDGILAGWMQQGKNVKNYFTKTDKDDGFQTLEGGGKDTRKVPIFFTDSVGSENKSLDLGKSLMIFSDFVNRYNGIKDIEHSVLSMRELVSKTQGINSDIRGNVLRDAAGNIELKGDSNKNLIDSFDNWIGYYIYGEKKKGNVLANKAVDLATSISSRKAVALNWLSAMGGHANAELQLNAMAKKSTYFSRASLSKARKETALGLKSLKNASSSNESIEPKAVFASMFFEPSQEDLGHEKANEVSISTMRKSMAKDYAFFLQRWSDDIIDNTTLNSMMMEYAIDPLSGKTYPIEKLKARYKDHSEYGKTEWKSLWDSLDMDHVVDGERQPGIINQHTGVKLDDKTYTDFRRKTRQMISRIKGNMSADDIAGYKTSMIGRLVMQYRGWIPATVRERAKSEQYNLTMEQFEVGRWFAAYDMVGKNLKKSGGQFIKEMIPFMNGNFDINDESHPLRTKYAQFLADNPHLTPDPNNPDSVTYEDYFNTYTGEVKALAKEVQTYLALAAALGLLFMAAGDDEMKENPLVRFPISLIERTMLEIGFYIPVVGTGEQLQLFTKKPMASVGLVEDVIKTVGNTVTETYDVLYGADWDKTVTPQLGEKAWELDYKERADKTGIGHYSHQWIPPLKFFNSILGVTNTTKRKDTIWDYLTDNETFIYK